MVNDDGRKIKSRQGEIRKVLQDIIRGEVLPRVFETSTLSIENKYLNRRVVSNDVAVRFQTFILDQDIPACLELVQEQIASGFSLRELCMGLFSETARELGESWLRDELGFVEVSIGLGSLHIIVHKLAARDSDAISSDVRHNILLASLPEEQHQLGPLIVSKIFEMEGWLVTGGPDCHTGEHLNILASQTWFDVIGLTASTENLALALKSEIGDLRKVSLNRDVLVMVGGNGFANHPGISKDIGADGLADDADNAIAKATSLLRELEIRQRDIAK